jgi:hypothetical protein
MTEPDPDIIMTDAPPPRYHHGHSKRLDNSLAYAATLFLHPQYILRHFENKWKDRLNKYLASMKKATRAVYDEDYVPRGKKRWRNVSRQLHLRCYGNATTP